jgi:UDP-N-acetylglucosamine 2-epimerase (non-hydrolysing)
MHVLHIVGARPNFMKAAPVMRALDAHSGIRQSLIHTGQHYDAAMSNVFFQQLEMREPDCNLGIGSGSHAQQTAAVMVALEPVLLDRKPDLVLVYGDVNSTVAAALVCSKLGIHIGHVEAGLRSRDRSMPEEINRLVTDQLSDLLFTPSADADENLIREGIDPARIHLVGNVMIDTLVRLFPRADELYKKHVDEKRASADFSLSLPESFSLSLPYALVTLHRPSNVDDLAWLGELLATLTDLSNRLNIIFPVHPRTRQRLNDLASGFGSMRRNSDRLRLIDPLPYLEFLGLQRHAALVITDSGGIQEETTFLGVPCLTVRENTERPVTITNGTNQLVGRNLDSLREAVTAILANDSKKEIKKEMTRSNQCVPLWDGHASERIAQVILAQKDAISRVTGK